MGCNARVCTPGTRLGLPELSLGKRQLQGRAGRGLRHDASFLLRPSNCRQDGVPALPSCHMCPFCCAGILPGFGGTQRLPRLVGLKKAVEMMLTSQVRGREGGAAVPGRERVYSLTGRRERGRKVLQRGEAFFYSCCPPLPLPSPLHSPSRMPRPSSWVWWTRWCPVWTSYCPPPARGPWTWPREGRRGSHHWTERTGTHAPGEGEMEGGGAE